jgi:tRNA(Ile)-lysidine synthetase-like protein
MTQQQKQRLLARFVGKPDATSLAAAVSGGCDSVALLFLLYDYCRIKKKKLCVFHVDHKLRESSSSDCIWVELLAKKLQLPVYFRKATDQDREAHRQAAGTEAWAREFRYRSFADMVEESGADCVVTGHTSDDQLETVVMRMFSGASLQGMAGIRDETSLKVNGKELLLWRPMLNIKRSELEKFLQSKGQQWLTDETNFNEEYVRNSVRHRLIPAIYELFPAAGEKMTPLLHDIGQAQNYLAAQAKIYLDARLTHDSLELVEIEDILKSEVVRQWLIRLGFNREINRNFIERIVDLWKTNASKRRVDHRSYEFTRLGRKIVFARK